MLSSSRNELQNVLPQKQDEQLTRQLCRRYVEIPLPFQYPANKCLFAERKHLNEHTLNSILGFHTSKTDTKHSTNIIFDLLHHSSTTRVRVAALGGADQITQWCPVYIGEGVGEGGSTSTRVSFLESPVNLSGPKSHF